jgi:ATP-dependent DNA helicase RecG
METVSLHILGPDPIEKQLEEIFRRLAGGERPGQVETAQVDIKEEKGRRDRFGNLQPGRPRNEEAAKHLAEEMACFANSPGGGAIILGIEDANGSPIGTEIDAEWLRKEIYDRTDRKLTINVRETAFEGARILILRAPEAIEPIRYNGRIKWRVADNCVDIDLTTWYSRRAGWVDWSAQPSGHTAADAKPSALEVARRYLNESAAAGDTKARELADASDSDLLRRIHVLDGDGYLTAAGSLLFVGTPNRGIDYRRRDYPGGDSVIRVQSDDPLLKQIAEVEQAFRLANRTIHIPLGMSHPQTPAIPLRAFREALINGVVHREWLSDSATEVEHIGDTVTVTSPGGFLGGIGPSNIITHPARPRYRSLAEAVKSLRLSEREGIGVDRMVCDMLSLGHREPAIDEIPGPYVRVSLHGGDPNLNLVAFMHSGGSLGKDVEALLLITQLIRGKWVDATKAMPVLQRSRLEAEASLNRLAEAKVDGDPVFQLVQGIPAGEPPAYRLSNGSRARLKPSLAAYDSPSMREAAVLEWARSRGRVSSTEAADIMGVSGTSAGALLTKLEEDGTLRPGRETRRGRGFFYVPAEAAQV